MKTFAEIPPEAIKKIKFMKVKDLYGEYSRWLDWYVSEYGFDDPLLVEWRKENQDK